MGKGTGSGLLGFGIVMIVVGAVMRYAINVDPSNFDVVTAGGILLLVGSVTAIAGILLLIFGSRRSVTEREQIVDTPHGRDRVVEREGWSNP